MSKIVKSGTGWRLGWNPEAEVFKGLVGADTWALELTEAELCDFCRLFAQLAETIAQISHELMDEETIACEVESSLIWLEATGYAEAYGVHLIVLTDRGGEGFWSEAAVPQLLQAIQHFQIF